VDLGWARPDAEGDFHVLGRGWGHGVGMSQHGAEGAARLGCSVEQILGTYYPGTAISPRGDRPIRVGLFRRTDAIELPSIIFVEAVGGPIEWTFNDGTGPGTQTEGETWRVQLENDAPTRLRVHRESAPKWSAPSTGGELEADLDTTPASRALLPFKASQEYSRGDLRFKVESAKNMYVTVDLDKIEHYLYGLAEVPSSWPAAALQAQAIAGRGYAHTKTSVTSVRGDCDCHILDSASDQVYRGYTKEGEPGFGHHWVAAVDATAEKVLTYEGEIASTFYSSTHGGRSERLAFSSFFGGVEERPYLVPVDDSRWEQASGSLDRGVRRWAVTYSREEVSARLAGLGVGTVQSIHVRAPTGAGGRVGHPDRQVPGSGDRYGGVEVIGTQGSETIGGLAFVQALNVPRRSELFRVETGAAFQCLPTTDQSGNTTVRRAAGQHRVGTAATVASQYWDEASDIVLATSITFPDALSAGALAARLGAPILLTRGSTLEDEARAQLERLQPERVHLMGGTAALSSEVGEQVEALGFEAVRVAGPNRFATAGSAALAAGPSGTGEAALAFGGDWPDAVSAGALSGGPDRIPTLLSERDHVPPETLEALADLEAETVLLIGGTAVLTDAVATQLTEAGFEVRRLSGPSRYATSVAVAGDAAERVEGDHPVVLATGEQFPDALSAGGLVPRLDGGLVLTTRCDLGSIPATREHLVDGPYDRGVIVGGKAAVSDLVREQATSAVAGGS
jgi:peptidoglycan hydrolase-like amidase